MASEVSDLKQQIEKAKESLKTVDENIKKITGRDPNEPRPNADGRRLSGGGPRGKDFGGVLGRRSRDTHELGKDSEPARKRVAVFSRLGPAAGGRRVVLTGRRTSKQEEDDEDEEEEEEQKNKPAVQSSVVSTAKKITKSELISAQNVGEKGKARNRRMFGMLLGTLARFDKDSQGRQTKQAKKQMEVETRLEEETAEERKRLATQRRSLFNERRSQQRRISLLEQKVALADELVEWEKEWKKKSSFIMTKTSPSIFFMPKDFTPRTQRALQDSKDRIKEIIERHKKSVEETMNAYDDEIKMLDGKQDEQDGKGAKNEGYKNMGNRGLNSHKRGAREEDPEEEMDLDSMEPQVDIKVEMDYNEGDDGERDVIGNGATPAVVVKKEFEITRPLGEQNHDTAMGGQNSEHMRESEDGADEEMASGGDNAKDSAKTADDEYDENKLDAEEVMNAETEDKPEAEKMNEEEHDPNNGKHSSEEVPGDNELQEESDQAPKDVLLPSKPLPGSMEKYQGEETAVLADKNETAESFTKEGTEGSALREDGETLTAPSAPESVGQSVEQIESNKSSSPSCSSDKQTSKTLQESEHKGTNKSSEKSHLNEPAGIALKHSSKKKGRDSSSSNGSEKESKGKKKVRSGRTLARSRSPEQEQMKLKPKELVGRRISSSERKARLRKRRQSESSSDSESTDSTSSSSSEDDRSKKRSRSRRDGDAYRQRSREKPSSRRQSGSRQRSRSRSREHHSTRRNRHRR